MTEYLVHESVSISPTEENEFFYDEFYLSVFDREVFYMKAPFRQDKGNFIRWRVISIRIYKEVRKWQRSN